MKSEFNKYGLLLDETMSNQFEKYYELLIDWNQRMNLTTITDRDEVVQKHFIDSVLLLTKYDSLDKRITFLKTVLEELGLSNVTLYHGRAEDFGKDTLFREQFDYCVSRAVAPLPILLEYCSPFIKVDGSLLLYKSIKTDQEVDESKHALDELNCKISEICTLSDDEDYKRYIIEIHKINETPTKYPRKAGKPKKNTL